jgi:signal transduction histidine kinase
LRRLPIRTKLAVALAVPLLALIAVTVLEVVKTSGEVGDISEQTELAKSAIGPSGIITALQNERTWLAVELIGSQGAVTVPVEGYDETRSQTDAAIAAFRDDIERRDGTVAEVFQEPLAGLEVLADIRSDIDASTQPRDPGNMGFAGEIFDRYTDLIAPFFSATTRISLAVDDPTLRQGAELADAVAREVETMSLLLRTMIVEGSEPSGIDESPEIAQLASLDSDFQHYGEVLGNATGPYARLAADHFPTDLVESTNEQVAAALSTGRIDLPTVLASVNVPRDESFVGYQDHLHDLINQRADDLQSAAEARRIWFGVMAVLALGVAVMLTWLVSRSITRPLRSLTKQAKEMAEHRLPDAVLDILETPLGDDVDVPQIAPVSVRTRDEVSDVADALNTVQDSALDLAVEQAVLRRNIADSFVNLGRRNQNLLGRQLDFITELESNETDPDTLASLFRLDHLATRMRRNAESLLVLAGIEPPRKWAAPVRLTDVIRAALGEVEDYQRVTIRGVEPATILGSAAADLAHLIAEFMENALTFSPPDQKVEVRGRHNHDGGYSLAVIDAGFGMPAADIAQANRRLSGTESFTIAPSKYLGHYVAGNLAARHGIHLQLDNAPGQGITASIDLPPGLLTSEAPSGDPITDPHGNRAIAARVAEAAQAARGEVSGGGVVAGGGVAAGAGGGAGGGGGGERAPSPAWGIGPAGGAGQVPGSGAGGLGGPGRSGGPGGLGVPGGPGTGAPPAEPMRTPSGLVKRSSRGEPAANRPAATVPSGDLLAALSGHTSRLGSQSPSAPPIPGGGASGGAGSPGRPALPTRQGAGAGSGPGGGTAGVPSLPSRRGGSTGPGSWPPGQAAPGTGTSDRPALPTRPGGGTDPDWHPGDAAAGTGTSDRPALPSRQGGGTGPGSWPPGQAAPGTGTSDRPALPSRQGGGTGPGSWPPGDSPPGEPEIAARAGRFTPTAPGEPAPAAFTPQPSAPAGGSPFTPAGPTGPSSPGGPARPDAPGSPGSPADPGSRGPAGPGRQGGPGAPGGSSVPGGIGEPGGSGLPGRGGGLGGGGERQSEPAWAFLTSGSTPAVGSRPRPAERLSPPPGPGLDPNSGGTTSSGLTRRVRGAQMPSTQPLSLRRGDRGRAEQAPAPGAAAPPQPGGNGPNDVYGFLSNFTAGVQRGLDEARRGADGPHDDR